MEKKIFRIIIAGSRGFNDYELLKNKMDHLLSRVSKEYDEIHIVCGKARGADTLGEQYAKERGYVVDAYPADWNKYGKSAGYRRNVQMAENADALAAFWDGNSPGTRHMIDIAKSYRLSVRIITY